MKKKLLIVMPHMRFGGVEISLLRMLKFLDYSKVDVTILFMKAKGHLLSEITGNIEIKEMKINNPVVKLFLTKFKNEETVLHKFLKKMYHKYFQIINLFKNDTTNHIYNFCLKHVATEIEHYDLVIDYHGYGFFTTAYVAEKVNSKYKVTWIHDEKIDYLDQVKHYYPKFNKFFGVSKSCVAVFNEMCPQYISQTDVFYNILDVENIIMESQERIDNERFVGDFKILSVGRLVKQKGYDLAVKAAHILKERGYIFIWFIIGEGEMREDLEKQIRELGLTNNFILLGMKKNPFPYIKSANLYVQSSRHEGYGLAIAEARILKKPIIATKIDCVTEQIQNGFNGFLVDIDEYAIAEKIIQLIDNPEIMENVKKNLTTTHEDYINQLDKIYSIMEL